jgi:hypothetical protein
MAAAGDMGGLGTELARYPPLLLCCCPYGSSGLAGPRARGLRKCRCHEDHEPDERNRDPPRAPRRACDVPPEPLLAAVFPPWRSVLSAEGRTVRHATADLTLCRRNEIPPAAIYLGQSRQVRMRWTRGGRSRSGVPAYREHDGACRRSPPSAIHRSRLDPPNRPQRHSIPC